MARETLVTMLKRCAAFCEISPKVGLFLMTVMLGHVGCAASSSHPGAGSISGSESVSPSEAIKQQLGTIGVPTTQVKSQVRLLDISTIPEWALEGDAERPELPVWCGFPIPGKAIVCLPMAAASLIQAATSDLKETIKESAKEINETFSTEPMGDAIADQLVEALGRHGADAVRLRGGGTAPPEQQGAPPASKTFLESEAVDLRLSFVPTKGPPRFQLHMTIRSRLRRRSDGVELSSHSVTYTSPDRPLSAWTRHDAEIFRSELQVGTRRVAAELVDFLVLEYPAQIEPLMPRNGVAAGSIQPTLGWNPSFFEDQVSQDVLSRIQGYTYDLRVSQKGAIVYERSGLIKALHKLQDPLPSCTDHNWRVKARFELDGRMRVSRWSSPQSFKTPC